jgi:hypothetical protein
LLSPSHKDSAAALAASKLLWLRGNWSSDSLWSDVIWP